MKEKTTDKPVSPQQPQNPNEPNHSESNNTTKPGGQTEASKENGQAETSKAPKTGDIAMAGAFASMFAGSTGALAIVFGKKRKKDQND